MNRMISDSLRSSGSKSSEHESGDSDLYPVDKVEKETCGVCARRSEFTMKSLNLDDISLKVCDECRAAIKTFIKGRRKTEGYYRALYWELEKAGKVEKDPL